MKSGTAIWLSALVYPGCGQFFQKRWVAGSVIGLGFSVALVGAGRVLFQVLRAYYALGLDFNEVAPASAEEPPVSLARLVGAVSVCLLIYGVNLIDVVWVGRKRGKVGGGR